MTHYLAVVIIALSFNHFCPDVLSFGHFLFSPNFDHHNFE